MTGYLVRLRYPFRFREGQIAEGMMPSLDGTYIRLFRQRAQAEHFTHVALPIWLNPFGSGALINIYQQLTTHYNMVLFEHEGKVMRLSLNLLCARAGSFGLEIPDEVERFDLDWWWVWWELLRERFSVVEQLRLRRHLGVLPWAPNPFDYQFGWITDEGLQILPFNQAWEMGYVVATLTELGLKTPSSTDPLVSWERWWLDNQESWSEERKDLIWWLMVPYPYEIVEVELETP